MNTLTIDLATKDYRDFGIAFLEAGGSKPEFLKAAALDLSGSPSVVDLAVGLNTFCSENNVTALVIDGPHAWKEPASGVNHMRIAERVLNTPAKTGPVGQVKPSTMLNFTIFSITLFQTLRDEYGWNLLTPRWASRNTKKRIIVEAFPTAAWRTLGLDPLPGKSRTKKAQLQAWRKSLQKITGYTLPDQLTHDELQAAVLLPVGEAIAARDRDRVLLLGVKPSFTPAGDAIEGYIAVPRVPH